MENNKNQRSVMDTFLFRYPQAIEEVFNFGIVTNDQELDSVDLQIIFDFEFFFKEGFQNYPHDAYENLDFVETCYEELDSIGPSMSFYLDKICLK